MARLAVTTHIKDYVIVPTNYGCKITGVELGKGILPLREIVRIIREESPLEHLVLELPIEAESDEEKSLEKEDNAVRKSVSYCREVLEIA
jgi:sugar phosphate isomerase/epimerase